MFSQPEHHQPTSTPRKVRTAAPPLSINTTFSPPPRAYPSPIAIPPEKFLEALKLYTKHCIEKDFADQTRHPPLDPPNFKLESVSTENSPYDPTTSISSLEGATHLLSGSSLKSELDTSTGIKVRHRIRRPPSASTRAKAVLIRHPGSCWECRSRRIPVSRCGFPHHLVYYCLLALSSQQE